MNSSATADVLTETQGHLGLITLNRPQALNALSLEMVRAIHDALIAFRDEAAVHAVLFVGTNREGRAPAFCAGGDIRFFHEAAWAGDSQLDEFFTEEYALNHFIHHYPKPTIAWMDGVVMGGGMGLAQGASIRIVTERAKLAMPETHIGLFPDVGGGHFLARSPGSVGEYLGLTGRVLAAGDAIAWRLADAYMNSDALPALMADLASDALSHADHAASIVDEHAEIAPPADVAQHEALIDRHFALADVTAIAGSLEADESDWAAQALDALNARSPLMLAVTLEQIRRGRRMGLADELRMERDLVHHSFHMHGPAESDTVEGIRALAIEKDHHPRWRDASIDAVNPATVAAFFVSPWEAAEHPLRALKDG